MKQSFKIRFIFSDQNGGAVLIMTLGMGILLMSMMLVMSMHQQRLARVARLAEQRLIRHQVFQMVFDHLVSQGDMSKITESGIIRIEPHTIAGYRILPVKTVLVDGGGGCRFDIRIESLTDRSKTVYGWLVDLRCTGDVCRVERITDQFDRDGLHSQEADHE